MLSILLVLYNHSHGYSSILVSLQYGFDDQGLIDINLGYSLKLF
jgi:hypothetical protein